MRSEGEEGLAVGLLMKRDAAVRIDDRWIAVWLLVKSLDLRGDVEVALRTQEESVSRSTSPANRPHELMQARLRASRAKPEVLRAAFGVESCEHRNRLDQRGFASAILTNEKRDLGVEFELVERLDGWNRERVHLEIANAVA